MNGTGMDKFHQLVSETPSACWAIVGNPAAREFAVFRLGLSLTTESREMLPGFAARGFIFIGVAGIVDGVPQTRLAVPLDAEALRVVVAQTVRVIEEEIEARLAEPPIAERATAAAFDSYMRFLMQMPDPRTDA